MRKLYIFLTSIIIALSLNSCNNSDEPAKNPVVDNTEMIEIPISVYGDIYTSESPLSRVSTDDLIGIKVYWKYHDYNGDHWYQFSHGLFDHIDNIKVYLLKDLTYKIQSTIIKDGKNVLYGYKDPFNDVVRNDNYLETDKAYYSFSSSLDGNRVDLIVGACSNFPEIDRLYGEVIDYLPQINGTINLEMKRVSFGVKVKINGLDEGSLDYKLYNDYKTIFDITGANNGYVSETKICQCSSVRNAFEHPIGFFDKFTLKVEHKHSIIDITENLGSLDINLYRNKINIINIDLQAPSRGENKYTVRLEYADI